MNHGSLFSGIGGFDLAAQWVGWSNEFQIEINDFCQKVLIKNFPNVKKYKDVKEFNGIKYRGAIDIISGGFPCQPFSVAGKQRNYNDDRYLWPEMLRIINEIKPKYVVCENVPGIINLALDKVLFDLENSGYCTETFIIPAASKNAPHKRERVWIIAYSSSFNSNLSIQQRGQNATKNIDINWKTKNGIITNSNKFNDDISGFRTSKISQFETSGISEDFITNSNSSPTIDEIQTRGQKFASCISTNSNSFRLQGSKSKKEKKITIDRNTWSKFPTQSPICGRNDGIPNRVDRIKSLGNAIVPQIAFEIFNVINNFENEIKT